MIERDAITYLFDQKLLAQHYLGDISDPSSVKKERPLKWRDQLEEVCSPAQIKILATPEFFEYILAQEQNYWEHNKKAFEQFQKLSQELKPIFIPLAISAGLSEGEWFLETHAETPPAHLVENVLFGLAVARFTGN